MNGLIIAGIASLPWIITPIISVLRLTRSQSLDGESMDLPIDPPLVSVVIPARNEVRNIERCLRSVLSTTYPALEVVVVDDQSTDGTGDLARSIAATDNRVRIIDNSPLPGGWFGKQWACQTGALEAKGELICFADADTWHSRDLMTRSVNAIQRRGADLFSIAGSQDLGSFWERLVQPQIFSILLTRYGGTECVSESKRVEDKIANGQCLFVRRDVYEKLGCHELVRAHVADDMMMAQRYFAAGRNVVIEAGTSQLHTRMYTSLSELIHGWGKNVFAGGRESVPMGALGRFMFPLLLILPPLLTIVPPVTLAVALALDLSLPVIVWSAVTTGAALIWFAVVYAIHRVPVAYALINPIGAIILLYIFLRAIARGRRVAWKGREYVSATTAHA